MFNNASGKKKGICPEHIIVGLIPQCRPDDYTPWPATVMDGMPAFGGLGDRYLDFLANSLKPHIDTVYRTLPDPSNSCIMGVSLGGLISLYAIYRQNCFGCAVSISGSMWYPGFISFMQNHVPCNADGRVLLLSGRMEGVNELPPLCHAADYLHQAHSILKVQLSHHDIPLIWDKGSHDDNHSLRLEKALQWITDNLNG